SIHGESFLKMFRVITRIYLSSKTSINIDTTKSSLNHIVLQLFSKMEHTNTGVAIRESAFRACFDDDSFIRTTTSKSELSSNLGIKMYTGLVYKNPLEDLVGKIVTNMV